MIETIHIDPLSDIPKYKQLELVIEEGVSSGILEKNTKLPSLNEVATTFQLSKDTVVKAYNALRERGVITAAHGKGYYITGKYHAPKKKVFVLFNELNSYKEVLHKSLLNALGNEVDVETYFHNHNIDVFEYLLEKAVGKYTHYVIMPTFNKNKERVITAIKKVPPKKLFILDRQIQSLAGGSVYQDFFNDAFEGLQQLSHTIQKYKKIIIPYQDSYMHPYGSIQGIQKYCQSNDIVLEEKLEVKEVEKASLYICLRDSDLVKLIKLGNQIGFTPGKDYGVLSYNDSPMKEIIHQGITVISTDFMTMGKDIAAMINDGYQEQKINPVKIIERHSI